MIRDRAHVVRCPRCGASRHKRCVGSRTCHERTTLANALLDHQHEITTNTQVNTPALTPNAHLHYHYPTLNQRY